MRAGWPPIIDGAHLPRLLLARDFTLTLLAWAAMAWLVRGVFQRLWELATDAAAAPLGAQLLSPVFLAYGALALALFAALLATAWLRRGKLRAQAQAGLGPAPLDPRVQAASQGLEIHQGAALRASRVSTLRFDAQGRVVGVDAVRRPPGPPG